MIKQERQAPAEPQLDEWCTTARLDLFRQDLQAARDSLLWSGQLESVVRGWVRRQLVEEVLQNESTSQSLDEASLESCPPEWSKSLHQIWQQQDQALLTWAELHWGHGLEALYLARKSELDRVTLRMLRVSDQGLSLELYHRIKAGEASFEQLSWTYGEGPERFKGGVIKNQRLDALPPALFPLLVNLHSFEVQKPRGLGKMFVLFQLLERQPFVFDQDTRCQLLMEQLSCWETPLVQRLGAHLASLQ